MPAPTDPTAFPTAAPVPYPHPPPIYELLLLLAPLAAPFLPAHVTATDYPAAIQTLLQNVLVPVDSRLRELLPRTGNWSHEFFTALLLSGRWTLATDVKLAFVLDPFDVVESPVDAAARVLWSVGMWRRNGYRGSRREELGWQADALLGAFTVPGKEIDAVRTAEGEGVHAVVWVGGRAWVVRLFGAGENPGVLGVEDIRAQLDAIVEAAENLVG